MLKSWIRPAGWLGAAAVAVGGASSFAQEKTASPREELRVFIQKEAEGQAKDVLKEHLAQIHKVTVKLSDYYLGLECFPVEGALRAQLGLEDDAGLLVEQVLPDSPAAKAGFKRYDVLLTAGEEKLKEAKELIAFVDKNKDKELTVTLLRGGKKTTITVTPAKRPEGKEFEARVVGNQDREEIMRLWEKAAAGAQGKNNMQFRMLGPGAVFHGAAAAELPKNMRLYIIKEGNEPAKISVKQDDKSWEVTDKSLDKLPEDVRKHVEAFLGRGVRAFSFGAGGGVGGVGGIPGIGGGDVRVVPGVSGTGQNRIEVRRIEKKEEDDKKEGGDAKLENLGAQIEELKKQLEKIQKSLPKQDKENE